MWGARGPDEAANLCFLANFTANPGFSISIFTVDSSILDLYNVLT